MAITILNISPKPRRREVSPFVDEEHYELYSEKFFAKCREEGVCIQSFIYTPGRIVAFVEDDRLNWDDFVLVQLYEDNGELRPVA